jgi:hypothetical protein
MAALINETLTNAGLMLIAKTQTGGLIEFTRIVIGDGYMPDGTAPGNMTEIVNPRVELEIYKAEVTAPGRAVVGGIFTNANVGEYWYRELGLYAMDPDLGEKLYCYGNAGYQAEYIPPTNIPLEKLIDFDISIGQNAEINAEIASGLYITKDAGDALRADVDQNAALINLLKAAQGRLTASDFGAAIPTQNQFNDYAESLGVVPVNGVAVKNLNNMHVWIYSDATDPATWTDQGLDSASTASDTTQGIVQSTPTDGENGNVHVDPTTGLMRVIGWDALTNTILDTVYPLNSRFFTDVENGYPTFGTWVLTGQGRTYVGYADENRPVGTQFGQTDQETTTHTHGNTLAAPAHTHTISAHTHPHTLAAPAHTHTGPSHTHTLSSTALSGYPTPTSFLALTGTNNGGRDTVLSGTPATGQTTRYGFRADAVAGLTYTDKLTLAAGTGVTGAASATALTGAISNNTSTPASGPATATTLTGSITNYTNSGTNKNYQPSEVIYIYKRIE